jgi:hypothetical protein
MNVRMLLQYFDDIAQRNLDLRIFRTAAADTMLMEETSSLRIR